jgi:hypothetical protein
MKETLTYDVGLNDGDRRLCSGKLTLQGGESDLSGIKVKLQPPRLVGGREKLLVSLVRLAGEATKLSANARRRQRRAKPHPRWGPRRSNANSTNGHSRHVMRDGPKEHSRSTQVNTKTQNIA